MIIVESVESDVSIMLSDFDAFFVLKRFEQFEHTTFVFCDKNL